ncbi:hypothetical protein OPT61_g1126 [Boeremia exigua]|uniref:Uncharacterized protein n=1 Tax=Boeremia exigua TaxID=749465 RepID=A0ACC2IRC2_9PLEO|nr:hypothetical protein OPT61_g1126 [Boeremia exigua]
MTEPWETGDEEAEPKVSDEHTDAECFENSQADKAPGLVLIWTKDWCWSKFGRRSDPSNECLDTYYGPNNPNAAKADAVPALRERWSSGAVCPSRGSESST